MLKIGISACFFHPDPQRAVFKGKLWLDTADGLESFTKIRNNPGQEFSWGFTILEAEPGVRWVVVAA